MLGIVAGFGELIGRERLDGIYCNRYRAIRQDIQTVGGRKPTVAACVAEGERWRQLYGGKMLYIVDDYTVDAVPQGSEIEFLNEPEYLDPLEYALRLEGIAPVIRDKQLKLWGCGISNLDVDSLIWMREVLCRCPWIEQVSIHRYSAGKMQDRTLPHRSFSNREEEFRFFKVLANRPYMVSEIGYHSSRMHKWGFWPTRLSPTERRNRYEEEIQFWRTHGAQDIYLYQERGEYEVMSFGRLV